ncbi:AAA family ATPase [Gloeothece verrucosa]|uniref:Endonuclease GajA/Old nuclease/RecF-like AAA domain-containing protein n=1 Tax=Gloeothece verrucosa (strain PCC 7822) TaxID=497965 RepID=E0U5X8_GLOV7|nr:AAA family ATPase [Gloeothece verrucosa]ADN17087.1 conserved hypothetical protein [Gloeothece verrucosa PCC 7822]
MDSIRIKNLRLLEDTGPIDIKPITLLLGANSSGKSTFLRAFPLMRQSVEAKTTSPILWYGQFVDFGSFDEAINNLEPANQEKEISFAYHFQFSNFLMRNEYINYYKYFLFHFSKNLSLKQESFRKSPIDKLEISLEIKLARVHEQYSNFLKEVLLKFSDHLIKLEINEQGKLIKFKVNQSEFSEEMKDVKFLPQKGLIPLFIEPIPQEEKNDLLHSIISLGYQLRKGSYSSRLIKLLKTEITNLVHYQIKNNEERIITIIGSLLGIGIESSNTILNLVQNNKNGGNIWNNKTRVWSIESPDFQKLRDILVADSALLILSMADKYLSNFACNISYIAPVRATAERYYRFQDLAVGEVDSQGKNLAMFIKSLNNKEQKSFEEWTQKYFGFSIGVDQSEGHVSLKLKEKNCQQKRNLADTGFGFSQVLPILTQLWWLSRGKGQVNKDYPITFAIEQPELHLHPGLQALLADSFIATIKIAKEQGFDLRLVIETHSETLVKRFSPHIANKNFDHNDINLVIFERENSETPAKVRIAKYTQAGLFDNWPLGFFLPDPI